MLYTFHDMRGTIFVETILYHVIVDKINYYYAYNFRKFNCGCQ